MNVVRAAASSLFIHRCSCLDLRIVPARKVQKFTCIAENANRTAQGLQPIRSGWPDRLAGLRPPTWDLSRAMPKSRSQLPPMLCAVPTFDLPIPA
jgi:hypothetical protein